MDGQTIRPQDKYCMSVEEASSYSMIGENRLRCIIENNTDLDWVLHIGARVRVKRPQFEAWLSEQQYI